MTRRSFGVFLDVLNVAPKKRLPITTVHLRLPSEVDTDHLEYAHRTAHDDDAQEIVTFTLHVEEASGNKRQLVFTSRGTKTRDYVTWAVLEKAFLASDRLESLVYNPYDRSSGTVLLLEVKVEMPPKPDQPRLPYHDDDGEQGGLPA